MTTIITRSPQKFKSTRFRVSFFLFFFFSIRHRVVVIIIIIIILLYLNPSIEEALRDAPLSKARRKV